jgi:hypothetical protein
MGSVGSIGPRRHVRVNEHADCFFPGGNSLVDRVAPFTIVLDIIVALVQVARRRSGRTHGGSRRVVALETIVD